MTGPDDDTPPEGVPAIPEEEPTEPGLAKGLGCPECGALGYKFTNIELADDGTLEHALAQVCPLCKGAMKVDRAKFRAWYARRNGR
jgi:hypothetical protein